MNKILIVDDDPVMLRIIERILSSRYRILSASSGKEALEIFDREMPDMVLSDIRMPEMDGYELRHLLREKSDVPFIFMTADESDESERKGFDIGAADYIRKPANADILLRRVGNIMQNAEKLHGLRKAASLDGMTQLLNKEAALRDIGDLCGKVPGVLLMIDLDSFKLVNDIHGHAMGDRILIRFAELIRGMIRATDLAGRLGGDEFIAYLQHVTDEAVVREKTAYLNEELLRSAREYMGEDMGIPLGASVGAVFVPGGPGDFSELCRKADQALYAVKNGGKHGVSFHGAAPRAWDGKAPSHMRRILGERNREEGALLVDFDGFQNIYRFISRLGEDFQNRTQFLHFTLSQPRTAEEFRDMLRHVLRRNDCVMQNGASQFFVLLTGAGKEEGRGIEERIRRTWAEISPHSDYTCDMESLGSNQR